MDSRKNNGISLIQPSEFHEFHSTSMLGVIVFTYKTGWFRWDFMQVSIHICGQFPTKPLLCYCMLYYPDIFCCTTFSMKVAFDPIYKGDITKPVFPTKRSQTQKNGAKHGDRNDSERSNEPCCIS